jgi:multiple sugar transport system permease protein
MATKSLLKSFSKYVQLGLLLSFSAVPIVWIFLTSFKNRFDTFSYPPKLFFHPDPSVYFRFLTPGTESILDKLLNSSIIAIGGTLFTLFTSCLAAYAFSRYQFKGRTVLLYLVLASRLLPPITAVIPLFMLMNSLGLIDTHFCLIIIYSALNLPFAIWMMKSYFDGIPMELELAAQIDGCSKFKALRHITLPLATPGMVATAIFVFVLSWNEYMFAFIFTSVNAKTVPVRIAETLGELQIYWQDMATLAMIVILPAVLFSYYMQKHMVKGLTAGALK